MLPPAPAPPARQASAPPRPLAARFPRAPGGGAAARRRGTAGPIFAAAGSAALGEGRALGRRAANPGGRWRRARQNGL